MHYQKTISVDPETAFNPELFQAYLNNNYQVDQPGNTYKIRKRSIDARGKKIRVHLSIDFYSNESPEQYDPKLVPRDVSKADPAIIIGSGPAGLFAALELINQGIKPIIFERGKDVQARRRDIASINRQHEVNPNSNYCFGEGGAGTFSDGKLYTRSKKRGDVGRVLDIFVRFGASESILYDAHPHIGTNKLPQIIKRIREYILDSGGVIQFNISVVDFIIDSSNSKITGVVTSDGNKVEGLGVILATGHSARDIYQLLVRKSIHIERKPFALGLRVEHPQELIDSIQYHKKVRGEYLPAAPYSLVAQTTFNECKRGVFSFCMCPGGFIVPSATSEGEVVVNGMSPSRRDSKFANSGIVVAVENEDVMNVDPLANMNFQAEIERKACESGGGTQSAPAQRLVDFLDHKHSVNLPGSSYQPGLTSVEMDQVIPEPLIHRLRYGFNEFGKKMKGYLTNEAVLVGVESRTSSPVRIPRDRISLEHINLHRLYPCGEGAGYAGGIVSAAIDGLKCASELALKYGNKQGGKS